MSTTDSSPLLLPDAAAWRAWLVANESSADAVWLILARKGKQSATTLTYDEALEEALCSGWIDGQTRSRDEATTTRRFTPRRARANWSARNAGIVERLIAEGRMRPRGQAEIDAARADARLPAP